MTGRPRPRQILADMLILIGVLWMVLTGGCTLTFGSGAIAALLRGAPRTQDLELFMIIGAICMAPGAVLALIGWALRPHGRAKT